MSFDTYDAYYLHWLWDHLPPFYKTVDDGTLGAVLSAVASQFANLKRSHDRLWEDQDVALADDWALPYLGSLLDVEFWGDVSERAERLQIAKTIYYRRRSGTVGVIEEIARDVLGRSVVVRETDRTLIRTPHRLDLLDQNRWKRGGLVSMQDHRLFEIGTPVDSMKRTPTDALRFDSQRRYRPGSVNCYAAPYDVLQLVDAPLIPVVVNGAPLRSFDPTGRFVPLFVPERDEAGGLERFAFDRRLTCRLGNNAEYKVDFDVIGSLGPISTETNDLLIDLALSGHIFTSFVSLERLLLGYGLPDMDDAMVERIAAASLVRSCGRSVVLRETEPVTLALDGVDWQQISFADLSEGSRASDALVDAERGLAQTDADLSTHHIAVAGDVGAVPYPRSFDEPFDVHHAPGPLPPAAIFHNAVQLTGSGVYTPIANLVVNDSWLLSNASQTRPVVRLDDEWQMHGVGAQTLHLRGVWFHGDGDRVIRVVGKFKTLVLENVTLDPGTPEVGKVTLEIAGVVEELIVRRSIFNSVVVSGTVDRVIVEESIVDMKDVDEFFLDADDTDVEIRRSTVFGSVAARTLFVEDSIVTGEIFARHEAASCTRYSLIPTGAKAPRPYRTIRVSVAQLGALFHSTTFTSPYYMTITGRLFPHALSGASDGGEVGVYNARTIARSRGQLMSILQHFVPIGVDVSVQLERIDS